MLISKVSDKADMDRKLIKKTNIIFTKSNADEGGLVINQMIEDYVKNNQDHAIATGLYAARNLASKEKKIDIWKINSEGIYQEGEVEN